MEQHRNAGCINAVSEISKYTQEAVVYAEVRHCITTTKNKKLI